MYAIKLSYWKSCNSLETLVWKLKAQINRVFFVSVECKTKICKYLLSVIKFLQRHPWTSQNVNKFGERVVKTLLLRVAMCKPFRQGNKIYIHTNVYIYTFFFLNVCAYVLYCNAIFVVYNSRASVSAASYALTYTHIFMSVVHAYLMNIRNHITSETNGFFFRSLVTWLMVLLYKVVKNVAKNFFY